MQIQQAFKENLKYNFWRFLPYVITVIALFFMFKSCLNGSIEKYDLEKRLDSINSAYDSIERDNSDLYNHALTLAAELNNATHKVDSLSSLEPKIAYKWHKAKSDGRDSLVRHICDTMKVIEIYDGVTAKADSMRKHDSTLIRQHELRENILEETVANRDSTIKNRDKKLVLKDLEMAYNEDKFNKKIKKKNKTIVGLFVANLLKDALIVVAITR